MSEHKICFVIALKYFRNYETFIKFYVDNIQSFYKDSLTIIVDNNSTYIQDIHAMFMNYTNVIIITNETECKFEIGAYKVGIHYLLTNGLLDTYDYYVFTQDNFVIKNRYDFNQLNEKGTLACAINSWKRIRPENYNIGICKEILLPLNLQNSFDKLSICWATSFILHSSTINKFFDIVKNVIIKDRQESCYAESYMSGILYYLNNNKIEDIDGDIDVLMNHYDCWTVHPIHDDIKTVHFVKKVQQKTEHTLDV